MLEEDAHGLMHCLDPQEELWAYGVGKGERGGEEGGEAEGGAKHCVSQERGVKTGFCKTLFLFVTITVMGTEAHSGVRLLPCI